MSFLLQSWRPLIDVDVWMTTPKTRCLGRAMVKLSNWTILHKFSFQKIIDDDDDDDDDDIV